MLAQPFFNLVALVGGVIPPLILICVLLTV
jgi:hypothetical protein